MTGIENTLTARLDRNGEHFEILVDPKKGYEYKTGLKKDFSNVLAFDDVFKDANKGERASPAALKKAIGTDDIIKAAQYILDHGELQLTTDQRRKAVAEKRAKIVAMIAATVMDPKTKAPHPVTRIELALEEARFHVDAFKRVEEQVETAIESIREIIPISTDKIKVAVRVPAQFAPKCYGLLKEYGIQKEEWANDGSLMVVVEMPVGMEAGFYDRLNSQTSGQTQTKRL
ncbi:ribosome assembly factor SBDS [Candidatus Micrarchaeota archaeon]|nr:ribosome assembly factor SBDS [Candidatus Micrarchaeota archaeon]